jgi:hypothetical protein
MKAWTALQDGNETLRGHYEDYLYPWRCGGSLTPLNLAYEIASDAYLLDDGRLDILLKFGMGVLSFAPSPQTDDWWSGFERWRVASPFPDRPGSPERLADDKWDDKRLGRWGGLEHKRR